MSKIWSKVDKRRLIYRLPFYVLLSTSFVLLTLDYLLYYSAGKDPQNYMDASARMAMSSPATAVFALAILVGTALLCFAALILLLKAISEKRFDWYALCFVVLGFLFHPWILGFILDFFIITP